MPVSAIGRFSLRAGTIASIVIGVDPFSLIIRGGYEKSNSGDWMGALKGPPSQRKYADACRYGQGTPRIYALARSWYWKAADTGSRRIGPRGKLAVIIPTGAGVTA